MIELCELPYPKDGLAPHITEKTLDFHYGKHHKGYVDNLNKLIKGTEYEDMELEDIIKKSSGPTYNNAAQTWNHTFFWNSMTNEYTEPDNSSALVEAINDQYSNMDTFKQKFVNAATKLFGSGWVWLVADGKDLKIKQTKNANEPLTDDMKPLLVCDVWEHAYYLDYQNDRGKFVESFFKVVNWDFAQKNWDK